MPARESRAKIAEADEWLTRNPKTLPELLEEIDKVAFMCRFAADSAKRRIKQLPADRPSTFLLSLDLERLRTESKQREREATRAAERGDLMIAVAAALQLGRLLATLLVMRETLMGRVGDIQAKRALSAVNSLSASHFRKAREASPEKIRAWIKAWSARYGTTRGARKAAAVHFQLDSSTITRRLKQK